MKKSVKLNRRAVPGIGLLGIPRSGTNYVRAVLELNFRCKILQNLYGWKHGFVPVAIGNTRVGKHVLKHSKFVWVSKHPLDSILSLYDYHLAVGRYIRAPKDWAGFLRSPIFLLDSGNPSSLEYRFASPVELWNALNWNYYSAEKHCQTFHFRFEDAYLSPDSAFGSCAQVLGLGRKNPGVLTVPVERVRRLGQKTLTSYDEYVTDRPFDKRDYYMNGEYSSKYSPDDLQYVQQHIDRELVTKLGYRI